MKYVLGIYCLFITLFYIAFFTFHGDFINGTYTRPYFIISIILLIVAFALDIIYRRDEHRAKTYPLQLTFLNTPSVIIAFFVPLINGNRTIGEILSYPIPLSIALFIGLFATVPLLGFVFGIITDVLKIEQKKARF